MSQLLTKCNSHFLITNTIRTICVLKTTKLTSNNQVSPILTRGFMWNIYPKKSEAIRKEKIKHNIPVDYELIYHSKIHGYFLAAQAVPTATTVLACLSQLFLKTSELSSDSEVLNNFFSISTLEFQIFCAAFIALNAAILRFVSRFARRIYSNGNREYVAVTYGIIPFQYNNIKYTSKDVQPIPPYGFLPWYDVRYFVRGKRLYFIEYYFRRPSDFNKMVNYE